MSTVSLCNFKRYIYKGYVVKTLVYNPLKNLTKQTEKLTNLLHTICIYIYYNVDMYVDSM